MRENPANASGLFAQQLRMYSLRGDTIGRLLVPLVPLGRGRLVREQSVKNRAFEHDHHAGQRGGLKLFVDCARRLCFKDTTTHKSERSQLLPSVLGTRPRRGRIAARKAGRTPGFAGANSWQARLMISRLPLIKIGRRLRQAPPSIDLRPDWQQAEPGRIKKALAHALDKSGGGWFVAAPSRSLSSTPTARRIAGRDLVLWKHQESFLAAPEACPHMGASLAGACTKGADVVCPWHGLALGPEGHGGWKHYKTFNDGVLVWVQLGGDATTTERPILAARPDVFLDAVIEATGHCEPQDILANRLDPWHGAHFHPHSFANLRVLEESVEQLRLRVSFRVSGPFAVEVDATFHCPDERTIVMTIVDGDGAGSVVETHATPIEPGRTRMIEATLATSDRAGFAAVRLITPVVRAFAAQRAARLWVEDIAYAERRFALRNRSLPTIAARESTSGKQHS